MEPQQTTFGAKFVGNEYVLARRPHRRPDQVFLLAIVGVVSACVQLYSIGYLHERVASYTALVTLFTASMVTVASTTACSCC